MPAFLAGLAALLILVIGACLLARLTRRSSPPSCARRAGVVLWRSRLPDRAWRAADRHPARRVRPGAARRQTGSWFGVGGPFGSAEQDAGAEIARAHRRAGDGARPRQRADGGTLPRAVRRPHAVLAQRRRVIDLLAELRVRRARRGPVEAYLDRRVPGWREPDERTGAETRRRAGGRKRMSARRPTRCSASPTGRARRRSGSASEADDEDAPGPGRLELSRGADQ